MSKILTTIANNKRVALAVLLLLVVVVAVFAAQNRKRKLSEIAEINQIIDEEIGLDGVDLKTLVSKVKPATGFDGKKWAAQVYNAKSYINDDEEAVYSAFRGKTRAQVASIVQAFKATYGKDIDNYLARSQDEFPYTQFLSAKEYQIVINIVKASK
jgi:hypothetical protein